jgi:hypothetical protein
VTESDIEQAVQRLETACDVLSKGAV